MFTTTWVLVYGLIGLSTLVNIVVPITGSATITPLLALLVDPHRALGMATFIFFLSAPPRIFFFWHNIQWREVRILLLPSAIAACIGALALVAVPTQWLLLFILLFAIFFLLKKLNIIPKPEKPRHLADYAVALLSGFLQGTGLSGSDIRNQYLYSQDLNLAEVHGTTAIIGGTNFLIATFVRLYTGQVTAPDILLLLLLFPIIFAATWLGKKALFKIPKKISDLIVTGVMFAVVFMFAYAAFLK
jgi:uncharacterized membrane protein YfcA